MTSSKFKSLFKDIFSIKRLSLIGGAIISSKVVLLLIAYFFNENEYNEFNKYYYTASIIVLFGVFGFNFAITRVEIKLSTLVLSLVFNLTTITIIYQIFADSFTDPFSIVSIFLYAFFTSFGGIVLFKSLFSGNYYQYFVLTFFNSVLLVSIIPLFKIANIELTILFPTLAFIWIVVLLVYLKPLKGNTDKSLKGLYALGLPAFVINGSAPLAFTLDKYFINHYYDLEIANAYTFAWGLVTPILYLGNLIENNIYSLKESKGSSAIKKSTIGLLGGVIIYGLLMITVLNYFPALLPASVNSDLLISIFSSMIIGYGLYSVIHYPVNAYLFKYAPTKNQKAISSAVLVIGTLFFALYYTLFTGWLQSNYINLIIAVLLFIFAVEIIKGYVLFFKKQDYAIS